jgi:phosphotransferase system  glucose/maltose/N-acetylglucosamine-specific IIC component
MKKRVNKKRKILIEMILTATISFIMAIFEFIIMVRLIHLEPLNNWPSSCVYFIVICTGALYGRLFRYQYKAYKKYEKEERERLRQANEASKIF